MHIYFRVQKTMFCKNKYCFYFHIVDFSKFVPFKDFKCIVHTHIHTTYILGTLGVHATTSVTHRRDPAHLNLRQVIKQTLLPSGWSREDHRTMCPRGCEREVGAKTDFRILNTTLCIL